MREVVKESTAAGEKVNETKRDLLEQMRTLKEQNVKLENDFERLQTAQKDNAATSKNQLGQQ
jgi:hypothetical protein